MPIAGYAVGFVDFASPLSIAQVAALLSSRVFGGIDFIEKDVDGEHDVGTLCLAQDFLGLQVDLFGEGGRYTVEIGTRPSASVSTIDEVCDLSAMLRQSIERLEECELP
jgi:hypothetical protein